MMSRLASTRSIGPPREFDRDRALAFEHDTMNQRVGQDGEVGPLQCRAQVGTRGTLPAPATARLLHPADVVSGAGGQMVDVLVVFETNLDAGLDDLVAQG